MSEINIDWRAVLRWSVLGLAGLALLLVIAAGYFVYREAWGTPLRFSDLLLRQAITEVRESPQLLTQVGIVDGKWYDFSSDKLDRYSLKARQHRFNRTRRFDAELAAWNRADLSAQDQLSYDIIRWSYSRALADEKYPWLGANNKPYPVEPAFGIQKSLPNFLVSMHQIKNARLARHYVARLKALGPIIDSVREDVARQADAGVIAPDFVIDGSVVQMKAFIAPVPGANPLVTHLAERTKAIGMDGEDRNRLVNKAVETLVDVVYPAYRRLIAEEQSLRKRATHDAGIWRLKGGSAYYADQLKTLTSTDMTPDEIHAYGLSEVARITAEADTVLKFIGLTEGTVGERLNKLMADRRFLYSNDDAGRKAVLARYQQLLGRVKWMLPRYFTHLPKIALDVRRVPPFAEKGSAGAYYERPSLDGSRPGVFFANLRDTAETPMWAMPTLAYHEGIPGHHMQIATATEIADLPYQRRLAYLPAFGEGWALYAEHLAKDMGLYAGDPYGDLGRLQAELFRAARLVVDTGLHAKRWSREQAIAYMQQTTGMANSDVTAEVERYVVWPGQACAYKIGMRTMLGLREQASRELGRRFDLKQFHVVVLENGAMPLWLLQRNVRAWIVEKERFTASAADTR
jgi:uncharacterized protein (DUF885 family)